MRARLAAAIEARDKAMEELRETRGDLARAHAQLMRLREESPQPRHRSELLGSGRCQVILPAASRGHETHWSSGDDASKDS